MEEDRDYIPDDTNLRDIKDTIESLRDQLEEINESLKEKSDVGGMLAAVVVIAIIILPSWAGSKLDRFSDRVWYSQKYGSDWWNTEIQRRPTDCDFLHAPIGTKRCSYTKRTDVFTEKERQALIALTTDAEEQYQIRNNTPWVVWRESSR